MLEFNFFKRIKNKNNSTAIYLIVLFTFFILNLIIH